MTSGGDDIAIVRKDSTEIRSEPLRVRIELDPLTSADGHDLRGIFECSIRIGDRPADQRLLRELLLGERSTITRSDIAAHLRPSLSASLYTSLPIAEILAEASRESIIQSMRRAADAAAFACGLIVLPPFSLDLTSPSLQRQQREIAQRSRLEQQAAGRLDHLRHAAELLKQFDSIRAAAPLISAGKVLERIAPADRGAVLDAMLASSADQSASRPLFAVAGNTLLTIDRSQGIVQPLATELPSTLGPLRSIQATTIDGQVRLLIGARSGVILLDPHSPGEARCYAAPEVNSSLGFNRAAYLPGSDTIVATHSDAGLVRWNRNETTAPISILPAVSLSPTAAGHVRNCLAIDEDAIVLAAGNSVVLVEGSIARILPSESASSIIGITVDAERFFVIREEGSVTAFDRRTREALRTDHRGGPLCAAGALPWADGVRLLLASCAGPIDCVGTDDSLVTRLNSQYRGFKTVTASVDMIAAVSPDRQRLVLWNAWDGRSPAHDLHLTSLARHRIADITFA